MNLVMIPLFAFLTVLVVGGSAQVVSFGSCPTATAIPNLNISQVN
jgi:hypothetical protein